MPELVAAGVDASTAAADTTVVVLPDIYAYDSPVNTSLPVMLLDAAGNPINVPTERAIAAPGEIETCFPGYCLHSNGTSVTNTAFTYPGSSQTFYWSSGGTTFIQTLVNAASSFYYQTVMAGDLYPAPISPGVLRKKERTIRSSIKKAIKLISGYGMEEDLKLFLGGNSIELSYPSSEFKFVIQKKQGSLSRYTERAPYHTPFELDLYTKTNVRISSLCVYVEDTPVLDQILAIAMFIKNGVEDMLLEKANYSRFTENREAKKLLANAYPSLIKRYPRQLAA